MVKIRLLIVDDHKIFLEGVEAVLSAQEDIEILGVLKAAKEAIHFLKNEMPDLLITDIAMPEMNGLEFIKYVKQAHPKLKILVVSMFSPIQDFKNINGYLLKETGYSELLKAIRGIVLDGKTFFHEDHEKLALKLEFNKSILTKREKEIVQLIADELTTDQIAEKLFLSKHTIETHKKNIFLKLHVNNAAGLIKRAIYLGYL